MLNLEAHSLALAIAKKTMDKNCFKAAHKTMDRKPPTFKIGDRVYFKTDSQANGILNGDLDIGLFKLSMMDTSYMLRTRLLEKVQSCNVKDLVLEPPIELWHMDTQFGRAGKFINHPGNLPTINLHD